MKRASVIRRAPHARTGAPRAQRGAVLYVALIMLLLLALIGIAGMQVAGMQEKMASNYRAVNRSFQNTEGAVRNVETAVEGLADRTDLPTGSLVDSNAISYDCDDQFDPVQWGRSQALTSTPTVHVRRIDTCGGPGGNAIDEGQSDDTPTKTYQITAFATDTTTDATSSSVIDTIFRL